LNEIASDNFKTGSAADFSQQQSVLVTGGHFGIVKLLSGLVKFPFKPTQQ
jgi:hypothetical protein